MDIFEAIFNRRSIRRFTSREVSREDVQHILESGRWAPSGLNNQPWRFLVLQDGDQRQKSLMSCTRYSHIVQEARVLIAVFLDRHSKYHHEKDCQSAGACIQNMLLAAHGLGLGAVWLGEIINQEPQVHQVLGTSGEDLELMSVIALGHPAEQGASRRKSLEELMLEPLQGQP